MPHTEGYGGESNWKETPGETTPKMVLFGEERPVKNKQHLQHRHGNR
jgi:hypothetical protein